MLSTKKRLLILLTYVATASLTIFVIIAPALIDFGFNVQDPLYFDRELSSQYTYDNGEDEVDLDFDVKDVGEDTSELEVNIDGDKETLEYTHDGYYIDPDTDAETKKQSIFWVHIVEEGTRSEGKDYTGEKFEVFDPLGILGTPEKRYTYKITEADVFWAENEASLHGAQFSLLFEIENENGTRVGRGEMDKTCGMVFRLEVGQYRLNLVETNYDISRNRLAAIAPMIIMMIAMPLAIFGYFHFYLGKKREIIESKEDLLDMVFLTAFGQVTFAVDIFIDVWMYAPIGFIGKLILNSCIIGVGILFSLYRGYKIKWLIPAIMEILFLLPMVGYVGDPYAPHITAFMGLTFSFLFLVWITGYERQESKSKLGKIITQAV